MANSWENAGSDLRLIGHGNVQAKGTQDLVRAAVWYVLLAGGVEKDLGISLSGSGSASGINGSATSRIGAIGRLGIYFAEMDSFATMGGLEYTKVTYDVRGGSVGADSAGFWTTVTWRAF